ncbi:hypothetical protein [Prevotella merdae]|uniref:hypothetical protein n=1 Tax=Prevotella merdae TaxID=2079531 RepID=UPI003566664B
MKNKFLLLLMLICSFASKAFAYTSDNFYSTTYAGEEIRLIGNAKDLVDFANEVNGGKVSLSAKLTADIDFTDGTCSSDDFPMIGNENNPYCGTFDGQGHRISNLMISRPDDDNVGFFSTIGNFAKIKNFIFDSTCNISGGRRVGLIGFIAKGLGDITISGVGNEAFVSFNENAGGILGFSDEWQGTVNISNCYVTSKFSDQEVTYTIISGIHQDPWVRFNISNCWTNSTKQNLPEWGGQYGYLYNDRGRANYSVNNLYSVEYSDKQKGVIATTDEEIKSGELAYKLNGSQTQGATWFQDLKAENSYPTPFGTKVVTYISDAKYATFNDNAQAYRFDSNDNVTAYVVNESKEETVNLSPVEEIQAGVPVILKSETAGYKNITAVESAAALEKTNYLSVSDGNVIGNGSIYILAKDTEGVGFFLLKNGDTLAKNKCYLDASSSGTLAKALRFTFDGGDATAIDAVTTGIEDTTTDAPIYNLQGQRVNKYAKGLLIRNGKKYLVK